jgi:hypothetical protein
MPLLLKELGKPFEPGCVGWKPGSVTKDGRKAMALAYIDSRDVMDRLDSLVMMGLIDAWRDEYEPLTAGAVRCRLYLCVGGVWIPKEDVGGASGQPDPGDKVKAAFSDALKRAAVKWGIGRYLYHLDAPWCEYDSAKKRFSGTPKLPDWALPGGTGRPPTYALPPHLVAEQAHDEPAAPVCNNAGSPPRENPALRAKIAQAFAQAATAADFARISGNVKRDHDEGLLTDVDLTHLRPIATEAKARITNTPAAAK